jgi:hypothetical protein
MGWARLGVLLLCIAAAFAGGPAQGTQLAGTMTSEEISRRIAAAVAAGGKELLLQDMRLNEISPELLREIATRLPDLKPCR